MRSIAIASTDEEIMATYEVMRQLRPNVKERDYLALVKLQQCEVGFQLAAVTENKHVTCVAGFRLCRNLGWGKYLYVDDLVTDDQARSTGVGREMLKWLLERARSEECVDMRLDSKVSRHGAHRFYLRERMDIIAFHFCLRT
jgi:GNAT superfamily N-acetyltransferase